MCKNPFATKQNLSNFRFLNSVPPWTSTVFVCQNVPLSEPSEPLECVYTWNLSFEIFKFALIQILLWLIEYFNIGYGFVIDVAQFHNLDLNAQSSGKAISAEFGVYTVLCFVYQIMIHFQILCGTAVENRIEKLKVCWLLHY